MKRLPDAEFAVLKAVWKLPNPVTSNQIMEITKDEHDWKPQTLLTILARLAEKGYLTSERKGRERHYSAIVTEEDYMAVETQDFLKRYRGASMGNLVKTLFSSNSLSEEDLNDLRQLLK